MSATSITSMHRRLRVPLLAALAATALIITGGLVATNGASADTGSAAPLAATATDTTPNTSPSPPSVPANFAITNIKPNSVTLTWDASTPGCCTVTGYELQWMTWPNDVINVRNLGNVTTLVFSTSAATQYRFTLAALDSLGHRSSSTGGAVMTPFASTGDTTPPSSPTNVKVTAPDTANSVVVSWSPATDDVGVTAYRVYRYNGIGISSLVATTQETSATVAWPGFPNTFYVRAVDAAGNLSMASSLVAPSTVPSTTPPISSSSTPPVSSSSPPTTAPACRVKYDRLAEWSHGFVATMTITNTGATPIAGWTLTFTFGGDQRITSSWSATYTQSGAAVTMKNLSWNGTIAVGGSISVGMQGTWTSSDAAPSAFSLNGAGCAVA